MKKINHLAKIKITQNYHIICAEKILEFLNETREKNILEIGVGRGNIPKILKERAENKKYKYFGADLFDDDLKPLKMDGAINDYFVFESGQNTLEADKRFDIVVMCHVLEHIENPKEFLNKLVVNNLTKNGVLILAVPNAARLDTLINSIIGRHYANEGHYYSWDKSHWKRFLEDRCGYREVEYYADGVALPIPSAIRKRPMMARMINACERFCAKIIPGLSFSSVSIIHNKFIKTE